MLFTRKVLDGIADGSISLAFRRWQRPNARPGGTQRTLIGVVTFDSVERVDPDTIIEQEAARAGFASLAKLRTFLDRRSVGDVYRVRISLAGPDPRVALREDSALDAAALAAITSRLERLDRASRRGPWTRAVLAKIAANPERRAPDLAAEFGLETQPFKRDVRKLKELGLTESLPVGYRLSPRGRVVLDHLTARAD